MIAPEGLDGLTVKLMLQNCNAFSEFMFVRSVTLLRKLEITFLFTCPIKEEIWAGVHVKSGMHR